MTTAQKGIRATLGLLELAKQLGSVSQACQETGYRLDSFYHFKELRTALEVEQRVVAMATEQLSDRVSAHPRNRPIARMTRFNN